MFDVEDEAGISLELFVKLSLFPKKEYIINPNISAFHAIILT